MEKETTKKEVAYFSAGCFWHVEEAFRCSSGVISTDAGYMGGTKENPTYEEVCSGTTGHAETVEVTYDPERISYPELLQIFWKEHDPTTIDRQGADVGSQYRSVIFFKDDSQKEAAEKSKKELEESGKYPDPIVTEIVPAGTFWKAEDYHQEYIAKRGGAYCGYTMGAAV